MLTMPPDPLLTDLEPTTTGTVSNNGRRAGKRSISFWRLISITSRSRERLGNTCGQESALFVVLGFLGSPLKPEVPRGTWHGWHSHDSGGKGACVSTEELGKHREIKNILGMRNHTHTQMQK